MGQTLDRFVQEGIKMKAAGQFSSLVTDFIRVNIEQLARELHELKGGELVVEKGKIWHVGQSFPGIERALLDIVSSHDS